MVGTTGGSDGRLFWLALLMAVGDWWMSILVTSEKALLASKAAKQQTINRRMVVSKSKQVGFIVWGDG